MIPFPSRAHLYNLNLFALSRYLLFYILYIFFFSISTFYSFALDYELDPRHRRTIRNISSSILFYFILFSIFRPFLPHISSNILDPLFSLFFSRVSVVCLTFDIFLPFLFEDSLCLYIFPPFFQSKKKIQRRFSDFFYEKKKDESIGRSQSSLTFFFAAWPHCPVFGSPAQDHLKAWHFDIFDVSFLFTMFLKIFNLSQNSK